MTNTIYDKSEIAQHLQDLPLKLQKEEVLRVLKPEKKFIENSHQHFTEMTQIQNLILQLQEQISRLELDRMIFKKEWDMSVKKMQHEISDLQNTNSSLNKEYEKLNKDYENTQVKLKNLHRQLNTLNIYKLGTLKERIKSLIRPRLGVLYQYMPQTIFIPRRYKKSIPPNHSLSISIVTPSFNHELFLERTILSIIKQNYPSLEYIIQDGASTDGTIDILDHYKSHLKHWESVEDNGQSAAINLGFRHATGEIMAYLNSDDILLPGSLNYVADYFLKHPEVDVIYSHRILIDEYDQEIGRWILPPHDSNILSWVDYIPQETLFWRRSIWEKAGGKIDERYKFAMDWDLLVRFQEAGAKFARVPRFLGGFRIHSQQKTTAIEDVGLKEMDKIRIRTHGRHISSSELNKNVRSYLIKHIIYDKLYQIGILRY